MEIAMFQIQYLDIIEVYNDAEMRYLCNDECEQFDGIVHPDEDSEYKVEDVTRVWRQVGEDYKCIYKREFYRGKKL